MRIFKVKNADGKIMEMLVPDEMESSIACARYCGNGFYGYDTGEGVSTRCPRIDKCYEIQRFYKVRIPYGTVLKGTIEEAGSTKFLFKTLWGMVFEIPYNMVLEMAVIPHDEHVDKMESRNRLFENQYHVLVRGSGKITTYGTRKQNVMVELMDKSLVKGYVINRIQGCGAALTNTILGNFFIPARYISSVDYERNPVKMCSSWDIQKMFAYWMERPWPDLKEEQMQAVMYDEISGFFIALKGGEEKTFVIVYRDYKNLENVGLNCLDVNFEEHKKYTVTELAGRMKLLLFDLEFERDHFSYIS